MADQQRTFASNEFDELGDEVQHEVVAGELVGAGGPAHAGQINVDPAPSALVVKGLHHLKHLSVLCRPSVQIDHWYAAAEVP